LRASLYYFGASQQEALQRHLEQAAKSPAGADGLSAFVGVDINPIPAGRRTALKLHIRILRRQVL
jgi:hypothetical protein